MAQIIKHRRGSLEALSTVTGSLQKGEIVIASGSSNLNVTNGASIVFAVPEDGQVQAINRFLVGDSIPNSFAASTYNGLVKGVPYYASGSKTLYLLGSDGNTAINLEGNILPFSASVDYRLDVVESSIGGGGELGSRVAGLEAQTGSYATTGSNTFVDDQIISGNIVLGNNGQIQIQSNTADTLFGMYDGNSILGAYYQMWGNNHASADARGSAEFVFDTRNGGGEFRIVGYDGSTWTKYFRVDRNGNSIVTGSLFVSGDISGSTLVGIGNVTSYSTSVDSRISASVASITSLSASVASVTGDFSSSVATSFSASDARITALSSSLDSRIVNLVNVEATHATTGSNVFIGNQTITGSLYVTQNLIVYGSSSVQNVTASAVDIGANVIMLNTATPAMRFGGMHVIDSGSTAATGSLLWDSLWNRWIYIQPSGSPETHQSALLLTGPKNSSGIGNEIGLTAGTIPVSAGDDHLNDSIITQSGGNLITIVGGLNVNTDISSSTIVGIGNATSYSSSVNSRLAVVEGVSSSAAIALNNVSGAFATSVSASNASIVSLSGSAASALNSLSSSVATSISASGATTTQLSSSFASTIQLLSSSVDSRLVIVEQVSASAASALNGLSSSVATSFSASAANVTSLSSSVATSFSASAASVVGLSGSTAISLNNVSGAFATSQGAQDVRLSSLEANILSASIFTTFSTSVDSRLDTLEGIGTIQGVGTGNSPSFANLTIAGDLNVNGSVTTINTTELVIKDKIITLASGSASGVIANGAGIEVAGANATFTYNNTAGAWTANLPFSASAFTGSINLGTTAGNTKRIAFRNTNGNLDLVPTASVVGDLVQWDGTDFVMSNVIDGGTF